MPTSNQSAGGGSGGMGSLSVDEEAASLVPTATSIEIPSAAVVAVSHTPTNAILRLAVTTFWEEVWASTELLFQSKLTWLLLMGPIAVFGDSTGLVGEATCFTCAGLALIPCAERLSFVTEQVAEHTNGTIGALLNATFGNAPELLIATAALRSGFYRVVQLAMLGSILTNLLFVFGMSCLIGGMRWQVQEIRVISGNVSVGMLYLATAGSLLPAALFLSGQLPSKALNDDVPTKEELVFCRINAFVMVILYLCYLLFQLGTHKEEFDDNNEQSTAKLNHPAKRNLWCQRRVFRGMNRQQQLHVETPTSASIPPPRRLDKVHKSSSNFGTKRSIAEESQSLSSKSSLSDTEYDESDYPENQGNIPLQPLSSPKSRRRRRLRKRKGDSGGLDRSSSSHGSDDRHSLSNGLNPSNPVPQQAPPNAHEPPLLSFRAGLLWLFIITLCISSMSDILVDTLEGFAQRSNLSQVFTSLVVVPYFSNIAEQASAILFAYRNEMDLCIGVTVGSAVQIGALVMPGSVLIGYMMDRSMTLYFHGFETMCYLFAVVVVAAVVQGGTTNWLVGATMIGVYVMMAAGFWVHETENLSIDAEMVIRNTTNGGL
ncbi:Vacuolar cation/proton exchanger [Seminavis robusta]|uniref:Vacuolar cation/proton exchanger n=1 Tax=Seminavis robusta TaxID=568900 RepID=A0A9N8E8Z2_9STRA|nr:Vacuolar cation/proton exchanger [Seminavis robusta]|eukprot:Sro757_g197890.1 Vacuolar cation/proton exchanger (600) ;mRNA; f:5683-7739